MEKTKASIIKGRRGWKFLSRTWCFYWEYKSSEGHLLCQTHALLASSTSSMGSLNLATTGSTPYISSPGLWRSTVLSLPTSELSPHSPYTQGMSSKKLVLSGNHLSPLALSSGKIITYRGCKRMHQTLLTLDLSTYNRAPYYPLFYCF